MGAVVKSHVQLANLATQQWSSVRQSKNLQTTCLLSWNSLAGIFSMAFSGLITLGSWCHTEAGCDARCRWMREHSDKRSWSRLLDWWLLKTSSWLWDAIWSGATYSLCSLWMFLGPGESQKGVLNAWAHFSEQLLHAIWHGEGSDGERECENRPSTFPGLLALCLFRVLSFCCSE